LAKGAFKGGIHPHDRKAATADMPIAWAPVPEQLILPMSQHLGAPCVPTVEVGQHVVRGEIVGSVEAFISAPVHSPVDGLVKAIGPCLTAGGTRVTAVTIVPDAEQDLDAYRAVAADDSRGMVKAAGIVGMGGATFPTTVKLSPPADSPVNTVILNGCECEPFLTCDHRLMVESPERVVDGARKIAALVGASRVVICVEDNKPDAVEVLRSVAGDDVEVRSLPTRYPQGAEKQLIWSILEKEVPHGKLPAATGALVHNVATAVAIADAIDKGKPLTERVVTVTGAVARPGNYRVLLGTLVSDLLEYAGGTVGEVGRIIAGGPMTGPALASLDVPVAKGTSGIVVLAAEEAAPAVEDDQPCIRCGRCSEACPMFLQPYAIANHAARQDWNVADQYSPLDCIECGCCSYVCPTSRPLVQLIRLAKAAAMAKGVKL
jgi:electron transport complex protein RnfC